MNSIPIIQCPIDCLASFSEVLEYDWDGLDAFLKQRAIYNPVVVDIGANVGAFALWAQGRFPRSKIICYEPHPETFTFLELNVRNFAQCYNAAVSVHENIYIEEGRNRLCTTITQWPKDLNAPRATSIMPRMAVHKANIVKMDCEGGESDIIVNLQGNFPDFLVFEYHSEELRVRCEDALLHEMTLVGSSVMRPGIGILKFAKI